MNKENTTHDNCKTQKDISKPEFPPNTEHPDCSLPGWVIWSIFWGFVVAYTCLLAVKPVMFLLGKLPPV